MADLAHWSSEQSANFLGVDEEAFDALAQKNSLGEQRPGEYAASDVAGLAEKLAAEAKGALPGWRGALYQNGFAHLPALVPKDQMDLLDNLARDRLNAGSDQPPGVMAMYGPKGGLVRVNYLDRDPRSMALISDMPFAQRARELVEDAVLYRLSIVIRSKTTPPELGRHRDPRWSARRIGEPVFAFGLHLDATAGESGDVYYSPGTHRLRDDGTLPDVDDPTLPEQLLATERGDAVVHNLGVVHGAHCYRKTRERITVYCSYVSAREVADSTWGPCA